MRGALFNNIWNSLIIDYYRGGVAREKTPYVEKWMILPFLLTSQMVEGEKGITEIQDRPDLITRIGEAVIIPPGTYYRGNMPYPNSKLVFHWSHTRFTISHVIDVLSFYEIPLRVSPKTGDIIGEINLKLAKLAISSDRESPGTNAKGKSLAFQLLDTVLSVSKLKPGALKHLNEMDRFSPVLEYIKNNYRNKITVEKLAGLTFLSPSRFQHLFKNIIGVSPMNYVIDFRMRKAQELLLETNLSIAEVAEKAGYEDQFHFSKLFKRFCHWNPLKYRQNRRWTI